MKASKLLIAAAAFAVLAAPIAIAAGPQANVDLRYLGPATGKYAIDVQNTSDQYIHGFRWAAPAPLRLTRIIYVTGGTCRLAANTIMCTAAGHGLAPALSRGAPSGQLTAEFAASGNDPQRGGEHPIYYGLGADTLTTW